jgi:hypothetical protein
MVYTEASFDSITCLCQQQDKTGRYAKLAVGIYSMISYQPPPPGSSFSCHSPAPLITLIALLTLFTIGCHVCGRCLFRITIIQDHKMLQ